MTEVFLGREALADGLSRHDLQRWYQQMYRGVYMPMYASPSLNDRALGAWLYTDPNGCHRRRGGVGIARGALG